MKLFLRLSFLGSAYCGFQAQKNVQTVQGTLTEAMERFFGYPCDVTGCSRTDSGVHAKDFCVTVAKKGTDSIDTTVPAERIPLALAAFLPEDISVNEASMVPSEFHPRYDVHSKEYLYRIWNRPTQSPFEAGRSLHYPRPIGDEALERMRSAAAHFVGKHDFAAYMASGSDVLSTVRTVYSARVERQGDTVCFFVRADGFLYNMVRIMMGTLLAVAEGKIAPEEIPAITESRDRSCAGNTVPACGLFLNSVQY